jgi:hypothetical protein
LLSTEWLTTSSPRSTKRQCSPSVSCIFLTTTEIVARSTFARFMSDRALDIVCADGVEKVLDLADLGESLEHKASLEVLLVHRSAAPRGSTNAAGVSHEKVV